MYYPGRERSNTKDQEGTWKGNSVAGTLRPDWARGRRVLGGSSGMGVGEWVNGRLADNFAHLKNTIDRLLLDSTEHVEKFKVAT